MMKITEAIKRKTVKFVFIYIWLLNSRNKIPQAKYKPEKLCANNITDYTFKIERLSENWVAKHYLIVFKEQKIRGKKIEMTLPLGVTCYQLGVKKLPTAIKRTEA